MASPDMSFNENLTESPLPETALPNPFEETKAQLREKTKAQLREASKLLDQQRRNETRLKKFFTDLTAKMKQCEEQLRDANEKIKKLKLKNQNLERKLEQCKSFARTLLNAND